VCAEDFSRWTLCLAHLKETQHVDTSSMKGVQQLCAIPRPVSSSVASRTPTALSSDDVVSSGEVSSGGVASIGDVLNSGDSEVTGASS
jgi:hypothetical protein